jgi:hypothetical protein
VRQLEIEVQAERKENVMSIGAVGAIGAIGVGSLGGLGGAAGANALMPGSMSMVQGSADGVAKSSATVQMASPAPSTRVDISSSARSSLSGDGGQADTTMGELAQALIVALMLELLQNGKAQ